MPEYHYFCECGYEVDLHHSINRCDENVLCIKCNKNMKRHIYAAHVEGRDVYPFRLWNVRLPNGARDIEVRNKAEHKKILSKKGFDSPFFHVGG